MPPHDSSWIMLIWRRFIESNYFQDAYEYEDSGRCPSCNSGHDCNNHYCLRCMVGGLCPKKFRGPSYEHTWHPWLQVRKYSYMYAVRTCDLRHFIGEDSTKYIHKHSSNNRDVCLLRKPEVRTSSSNSIHCHSCTMSIPRTDRTARSRLDFLVCSLECLVIVAGRKPGLNLFQMEDGVMEYMVLPLLVGEKYSLKYNRVSATIIDITLDVGPIIINTLDGPLYPQLFLNITPEKFAVTKEELEICEFLDTSPWWELEY